MWIDFSKSMKSETNFKGSILETEIRNANSIQLYTLKRYITMAYNNNLLSNFWIDANNCVNG